MKEILNILVAVLWFILVIGLVIAMLVAALGFTLYRLFRLDTNYSLKIPNLRLVK